MREAEGFREKKRKRGSNKDYDDDRCGELERC